MRRHVRRWASICDLLVRNLLGRTPVVSSANVVISMTTYGRRTHLVFLALESIGRGTMRPGRLILWLDDPNVLSNVPRTLRRLQKRGLEIHPTADYGPHKKYYPYLSKTPDDALSVPLVIADDDFDYPRNWLKDLMLSFARAPEDVVCSRAHKMSVGDLEISPYATWQECRSTQASPLHFATGIGGVLYPPRVQRRIRDRGEAFLDKAPRADDVWLHYVTVVEGASVRQVNEEPLDLTMRVFPLTQKQNLNSQNIGGSFNDVQIRSTYDASTVAYLARVQDDEAGDALV